MKRVLALLLVLIMAAGAASGCAGKAAPALPEGVTAEQKDGLTIYTDTKSSPFENSGLRITVKKGGEGYAKFVKTDLEGRETADYYTFDYFKNVLEKYYYVPAMGSAYYYYYDLEKKEILKVEDQDHMDITQKMKDSGRLDSAREKIEGELEALEGYYKGQYNMTIKEAVTQE